MEIDKAIRIFSRFLNASWETIVPLLSDRPYTSDECSKSDWLQSNWEILIERKVLPLNEYLDVYGEGADFNGESSRITDVKSTPTHSVKVLIVNANDLLNKSEVSNIEYLFERLVGFKDVFYTDTAPFNYVLVQDADVGIERVFLLEDVRFILRQI